MGEPDGIPWDIPIESSPAAEAPSDLARAGRRDLMRVSAAARPNDEAAWMTGNK